MNRKNKSGGIVALVMMVLLIALIGFAAFRIFYREPQKLSIVTVNGDTDYTVDEVMEAAGLEYGQKIDDKALDAIKKRLNASGKLAVDDVQFTAKDSLLLSVHDRERSALVIVAGQIVVIDRSGYIVEVTQNTPFDLELYITGTQAKLTNVGSRIGMTPEKADAVNEILTQLYAQGMQTMFTNVDVDSLSRITAVTKDGMRVTFGTTENLAAKVDLVRRALQNVRAQGERGTALDVSNGKEGVYTP